MPLALGIGTGVTFGSPKAGASGLQFVGVSGLGLVASVGSVTVTAIAFISQPVTGNTMTAAVGTVTVNARIVTSVSVTGQAVTVSAGTVTVTTGAVVFQDNFNRADQNLEASANWTQVETSGTAGSAIVSSNMLGAVATSQQCAYQSPDLGSANNYVQVSVQSLSASPGMFVCNRLTDHAHFVGTIVNTGTGGLEVWRNVGGSYTNLNQGASAMALSDIMRTEVEGGNYRTYRNGNLTVYGQINDASLTSTRQGFMTGFVNQNPAFDDYEAGLITAGVAPLIDDWVAGTNTTMAVTSGGARYSCTRNGAGNPRIARKMASLVAGGTYRIDFFHYVGTGGLTGTYRVSADANLTSGDYAETTTTTSGTVTCNFTAPVGGIVYFGLVLGSTTNGDAAEVGTCPAITRTS